MSRRQLICFQSVIPADKLSASRTDDYNNDCSLQPPKERKLLSADQDRAELLTSSDATQTDGWMNAVADITSGSSREKKFTIYFNPKM